MKVIGICGVETVMRVKKLEFSVSLDGSPKDTFDTPKTVEIPFLSRVSSADNVFSAAFSSVATVIVRVVFFLLNISFPNIQK